MEEASGGGHQEDQNKEGRRSKSKKVERWCGEVRERNEVHPATLVDGDKTGLKLVMDGWDGTFACGKTQQEHHHQRQVCDNKKLLQSFKIGIQKTVNENLHRFIAEYRSFILPIYGKMCLILD